MRSCIAGTPLATAMAPAPTVASDAAADDRESFTALTHRGRSRPVSDSTPRETAKNHLAGIGGQQAAINRIAYPGWRFLFTFSESGQPTSRPIGTFHDWSGQRRRPTGVSAT